MSAPESKTVFVDGVPSAEQVIDMLVAMRGEVRWNKLMGLWVAHPDYDDGPVIQETGTTPEEAITRCFDAWCRAKAVGS